MEPAHRASPGWANLHNGVGAGKGAPNIGFHFPPSAIENEDSQLGSEDVHDAATFDDHCLVTRE
jgi:hypothetical protein